MAVACSRCTRHPGWEPVVVDGVSRLRRCVCWREAHRAHSSVPAEFAGARWPNWDVVTGSRRAFDVARRFAAGGVDGLDLFVSGGVGTGKTRLACTILNELWCRSRITVEFARVPLALYRLRPSHGGAADDEFRRLAHVQVLVLDDLGAEREVPTDFTRRMLLMLYEARYDAGFRTLWTSVRPPSELATFLGDARMQSRLVGRATHLSLVGPDWRALRGARPRSGSVPAPA